MSLNLVVTSCFKVFANNWRSHSVAATHIPNLLGQSLSSRKYSSAFSEDIDGQNCDNIKINSEVIKHLERTSLVGFGSEEAVLRLEEAIKFASVLYEVNTSGVQPMDSVLENETLYLREDETSPTSRKDILLNAAITDEDYFVAPPGNIPLEASKLAQDLIKTKV